MATKEPVIAVLQFKEVLDVDNCIHCRSSTFRCWVLNLLNKENIIIILFEFFKRIESQGRVKVTWASYTFRIIRTFLRKLFKCHSKRFRFKTNVRFLTPLVYYEVKLYMEL